MYIIDKLKYYRDHSLFLLIVWNYYLKVKGFFNLMLYDDKEAILKLYYKRSGKYPDLTNPKTFSEKIQWLKLNDKNQLLPICADKYEVRQYLIDKGYQHILNNLISVYDKASDIDLSKLPQKFVLKATHSSGWNILCKNKNEINWFFAKWLIRIWLKSSIYWNGREWHYRLMKPRIVCEEFLENEGNSIIDYKFYCFNGVPKFIQANMGRNNKKHIQNFYDLDWNLLPFGKDIEFDNTVLVPKPKKIDEMIKIATDLSLDFKYVRVDFYEVKQGIIFGELTFFPASGMPDFKPKEYDRVVGEFLKIQ